MQFDKDMQTTKHSGRHNSMQYIILHHTGGSTNFDNQVNYLANNPAEVSCHYVVGQGGELAKISDDVCVTRHAGISQRKNIVELNDYSIGIEIVSDGRNFTDIQREKVKELVRYLVKQHNIPWENVLRHKDVSPNRKKDVGDNFWSHSYDSYLSYVNSLMETKYTQILADEIADGYKPIFHQHSGTDPISEREVKELIDIFGARYEERMKKLMKAVLKKLSK